MVPSFDPWVQALYMAVVDKSDIFVKLNSDRMGRPAVRSVLALSCCSGMDALCEKELTMILSA
jgi:hypothetical protein